MTSLLKISELKVHFPAPDRRMFGDKRVLKAVDGVSFDVQAGETLGIVGESGCGKSTLARAILGLVPITSGTIEFEGRPIAEMPKRERQVVFQDPLAALNPRQTVGEIVAEPLRVHEPDLAKSERQRRIREALDQVGLSSQHVNRYPHEFSGGQCQRIGIARALVGNPRLLICDEPVSALDVSIQAQIVNLLMQIQRERSLTMLFIAHDLSVVKHISKRVMVMYLGRVAEIGTRDALYANPQHPYTRALISAVPRTGSNDSTRHILLSGDLPSAVSPPSGCRFRTRCPIAEQQCAEQEPQLKSTEAGSLAACHFTERACLSMPLTG